MDKIKGDPEMINMGLKSAPPFSSEILGHMTSSLCDSLSSSVKKSAAITKNPLNIDPPRLHLFFLSQIAIQKTKIPFDSSSLFLHYLL